MVAEPSGNGNVATPPTSLLRDRGDGEELRGVSVSPSLSRSVSTSLRVSVSPSLSRHSAGVSEAIRACLPDEGADWKRRLFELARRLKGMPTVRESGPEAVTKLIHEWYHLAAGRLPKEEDADSVSALFWVGWDKARLVFGQSPLELAWQEAQTETLPPAADRFTSQRMRLLVALCWRLQLASGSNPFFLGCRAAARLLGIHFTAANYLLRYLERCGIIERVITGTPSSKRANRYLFLS